MRTREVGMMGGLVAVIGVGSARFIDDCGRIGVRAGSSIGDDAIRLGARRTGSLVDDPAARGAVSIADEAVVRGGVSEGTTSSRLGARVLEEGLEQGVQATIDGVDDDELPHDSLARYREGTLRRARISDPWLLEGSEVVDDLGLRLVGVPSGSPVALLARTDDDGRTLSRDRGDPLPVDDALGQCVVHDVECIVLACPSDDSTCFAETRRAWKRVVEGQPPVLEELLRRLYSALADATAEPVVVRLDVELGESKVRRVTARLR